MLVCVWVSVWVILSSVGFRSPRWCCVCVCVCVYYVRCFFNQYLTAPVQCVYVSVLFLCVCVLCARHVPSWYNKFHRHRQAQTGETTQSYTRYNETHRHRHLQGQTQTKATQSEGHKQNKRSTDRLNKIKTYKGSKDVQDKKIKCLIKIKYFILLF